MNNSILFLDEMTVNGRLFCNRELDERIEAYIPTTNKENHASTLLQLHDGSLFCCWMSGSAEGDPGMNIVGSLLRPESDCWEPSFPIAENETHSLQNPVPYQNKEGVITVYYTEQETRNCTPSEWQNRLTMGEVSGGYTMQHTALVKSRKSFDNGKSWSEERVVFSEPGSFIRHRLIVNGRGELLFPCYYSTNFPEAGHYGADFSCVRKSSDEGLSWQKEIVVPESVGLVHGTMINGKSENEMIMFFRSRFADYVYRSLSEDYGDSWSVPQPTVLPNNNSSITAVNLRDGRTAMIYNHYQVNTDSKKVTWTRVRVPLTLAISNDFGNSWPLIRHIDSGDGFIGDSLVNNRSLAYPSIYQDLDGDIHCTCSFGGRKMIKYMRLPETWL